MTRRRRHRVVLRPKVKQRRFRQGGAALAIAGLAAVALAAALQARRDRPSRPAPQGPVELAFEGIPAELLAGVERAASGAAGLEEAAEAVRAAFPVFKEVSVRRPWKKSPVLSVVLRRPVGRSSQGRYLSEEGVLFSAPESLFPEELPRIDAPASGADLQSLAGVVARLKGAGLKRIVFVSPEDGWKAEFEDGTEALWGSLAWTEEKAQRLRQAIASARADLGRQGGLRADLRFFEDGKILVR